jgi:hypothetical protein
MGYSCGTIQRACRGHRLNPPSEWVYGIIRNPHLNWRGRSLTDIRTIVELIAATKTKTGLAVQCAYDPSWYPTGFRISDGDYATIPLRAHKWHGEWNYSITA